MNEEQHPHQPSAAPQPSESSKPAKISKHTVLIAASITAIVVVGIIAIMLLKGREGGQSGGGDFAKEYLSGCKKGDVSFTSPPVPLAQLGYIEPMGKTSDGHVTPTDHVYVSPINKQAADNSFDVVMPADGIVTSIQTMPAEYIGDRNQKTAPEDHRLVIAHNCQYVSIFIHVHKLSDTLQAVAGAMQPNQQKRVSIALKAGDKLGKIGGNPVDWSLMDASKTLTGFITPDLYKGEPWKVHVIDPFSMYSGSLQTQLVAKSVRSLAPYGGKIDYDKKGYAIGNWFREGTNGYAGASRDRYWDGHLSIAPNYVDPASATVSIGNWQSKAAQFTAKTGADPATVNAASGPVKYELVDVQYVTGDGKEWMGNALGKNITLVKTGAPVGVLLVQVLDGEKLKVERFPGKTAAQVTGFTSAAQVYER